MSYSFTISLSLKWSYKWPRDPLIQQSGNLRSSQGDCTSKPQIWSHLGCHHMLPLRSVHPKKKTTKREETHRCHRNATALAVLGLDLTSSF